MKSGRSRAGQKAAGSHTAALAGSDTAVDAVFHQAGVIRADTLSGLLDVAALLSCQPVPRGRRVAVLTNAGGLGILCADACEVAGLELPAPGEETREALAAFLPVEASVANPVDLLGSATAESFEQALPLLLADPGIDAVIALFVPAASVEAADVGAAISRATATANQPDKPVLAAILAASGAPATLRRAAQIPAFPYPEAAAAALGHAAEYGQWLRRSAGTVPQAQRDRRRRCRGGRFGRARRPGRRVARSVATRRLLVAYGLPHRRRGGGDHRRRGGRSRRRARLPGRRQDSRAGRAQDRDGRRRARPQRCRRRSRRDGADRLPRDRAADDQGRRRAARRRRAGSRLRPARRVRAGRGVRRADRRCAVPALAAHGRRRRGARRLGQGGTARRRLPRCSRRRRRRARRRPPATLAARRRLPGARGARPQSRDRPPRPGRRRGRAHSRRATRTSAPTPRAGSAIENTAILPKQVQELRERGLPGHRARLDRRGGRALARRRGRAGRASPGPPGRQSSCSCHSWCPRLARSPTETSASTRSLSWRSSGPSPSGSIWLPRSSP